MAQALWRAVVQWAQARRGPEQAERRRRRRALAAPRARILEQTGAALGGNFLQNSCVAPNRCRFASNSKKTNQNLIITIKGTICKNLKNNFLKLFLFLKLKGVLV